MKISTRIILLCSLLGVATQTLGAEYCDPNKNESFDDLKDLDEHMKNFENPKLPKHKRGFCKGMPRHISERLTKSDFFIENQFTDTLAFENPPGPVNGGMCWLHSRLQRNFTYLANYRPDLPKPSKKEAMKIINRIVNRKGVTEIPGFKNLHEFSTAYKAELIEAIDGMGWRCVANPTDCPARLLDSYNPTAKELQGTMEGLYKKSLAQHGDIQIVRTRRMEDKDKFGSAVRAHSLTILKMEPIRQKNDTGLPGLIKGYRMRVLDPNYPSFIHESDYLFGDTTIRAGFIDVVPYPHYEYDGDIPEMNAHINKYCKQ